MPKVTKVRGNVYFCKFDSEARKPARAFDPAGVAGAPERSVEAMTDADETDARGVQAVMTDPEVA